MIALVDVSALLLLQGRQTCRTKSVTWTAGCRQPSKYYDMVKEQLYTRHEKTTLNTHSVRPGQSLVRIWSGTDHTPKFPKNILRKVQRCKGTNEPTSGIHGYCSCYVQAKVAEFLIRDRLMVGKNSSLRLWIIPIKVTTLKVSLSPFPQLFRLVMQKLTYVYLLEIFRWVLNLMFEGQSTFRYVVQGMRWSVRKDHWGNQIACYQKVHRLPGNWCGFWKPWSNFNSFEVNYSNFWWILNWVWATSEHVEDRGISAKWKSNYYCQRICSDFLELTPRMTLVVS